MKKVFLLLLVFALAYPGFSQYSLTFCKSVSVDGKAEMPASSFKNSQEGSHLKMLIKSDAKFDLAKVEYRIFYVDANGKEAQISKMAQSIEPAWDYIWKEVVLYDSGTYRVKVYDNKGTYLTSANLSIKN